MPLRKPALLQNWKIETRWNFFNQRMLFIKILLLYQEVAPVDQLHTDSYVSSFSESCPGKDIPMVFHRKSFGLEQNLWCSWQSSPGEQGLCLTYFLYLSLILCIEVALIRYLFTNWLSFTTGWWTICSAAPIYSWARDPCAGSPNTLYNLITNTKAPSAPFVLMC